MFNIIGKGIFFMIIDIDKYVLSHITSREQTFDSAH
jgi:hypothetical protein